MKLEDILGEAKGMTSSTVQHVEQNERQNVKAAVSVRPSVTASSSSPSPFPGVPTQSSIATAGGLSVSNGPSANPFLSAQRSQSSTLPFDILAATKQRSVNLASLPQFQAPQPRIQIQQVAGNFGMKVQSQAAQSEARSMDALGDIDMGNTTTEPPTKNKVIDENGATDIKARVTRPEMEASDSGIDKNTIKDDCDPLFEDNGQDEVFNQPKPSIFTHDGSDASSELSDAPSSDDGDCDGDIAMRENEPQRMVTDVPLPNSPAEIVMINENNPTANQPKDKSTGIFLGKEFDSSPEVNNPATPAIQAGDQTSTPPEPPVAVQGANSPRVEGPRTPQDPPS